MIRKLRLRFSALVLAGLLLVTAGVVGAINYGNWSALCRQKEEALTLLVKGGGRRPGELGALHQLPEGETPPALPEGETPPEDGGTVWPGERRAAAGQPFSDSAAADLSNFYTVRLDGSGTVTDWSSDREDLYSDSQIQELADLALASGDEMGRVGSQFYRTEHQGEGTLLVVVDARLEVESAQRLAVTSALAGLVAWLVMSAGAVLLIRRMTRPVQEAFDKQKQFVMDASHELKTPLSVISANAEALAGEIGENQWLDYIRWEVRRTDRLVQNLLALARLDRGAVQVRRQPFDLSRAALSVALPFESAVFEAGKTLTLDVPEDLWCTGDEEMIQQLLVILLDNAVKYADPGGAVTLTLRAKGERRVIAVRNTGPGIEKEDLPRVFDRFYRADKSRNRERSGSGLGLALAKTIVDAHRGKITVESQPGEWALFTVTL